MTVRTTLKKTLMPCISMVSQIVSRSRLLQKCLRHVSFIGKGSIIRGLSGLPQIFASQCLGINYSLNLNDILQREIYFNEFDRKQLPRFLSLMPNEGICFDIGANVGFYTFHMAKKLGDKGGVFSFEPHPDIFKALVINSDLNHFLPNIYLCNRALSDKEGLTEFFLPPPECSGSGSLTHHNSLSGNRVEVRCITLDEFAERSRIDEIAFMKIDVEGSEFEVIAGAHKLMTEKRIKKIYVEFNGDLQHQKGHTLSDFLDLFASYKYFLDDYNAAMFRKISFEIIDPKTIVTDFVFIPAVA